MTVSRRCHPDLPGLVSQVKLGRRRQNSDRAACYSEEAVEFGELDQFLRLNENWEPLSDDKPLLRAVPVGIPGAYAPAQMNPEHISPAPSPIKTKPPRRDGEIDAGDKLGDAGLHGVNVTEDDLLKLVEELGLDGADASDFVKGLTGEDSSQKKEQAPAPPATEETAAAAEAPEPPAKKEAPVPEKSEESQAEGPVVKVDEVKEAEKTSEPGKAGATTEAAGTAVEKPSAADEKQDA